MRKNVAADLVLLGVTFSWGATFVLVKEAVDKMPPFTFLGVRFLFAALILGLIMVLFFRDTVKGMTKQLWVVGSWIGLLLFGGYALQTFGLLYTTASNAGFITGLSVVMVPIFAYWFLRQRLKRNAVIGVIVATIGLAFLSLTQFQVNLGDLLVFFCAICYGLHIICIGKYTTRFHALPFAFVQILSCGLFNMIGGFLFEDVSASFSADVLFDLTVFSALLICSVIATAFAFVAQNQFQKFTTPTRTALIFAMEPVFAALTGYLWAGDRLGTLQVIGCLCILGGMLIAELGGGQEEVGQKDTSYA
ncbi:EamA family transporter [Tumebacillus algifaecis]|uniref:EamA family transporter n=1 Tax=Tumebacillus algifaecis TaxID=1214604 RepID=A0A223D0K8_9BACL|nr:DMT family transporter [Tumebacillus algifaecis]ASS74904.1 EamA family transporter [Tumebacillus algifaecis]